MTKLPSTHIHGLGFGRVMSLLIEIVQNFQLHALSNVMSQPTKISGLYAFMADEDGTTAVEYAVMLALIIAVCAASVSFLASKTKESFDTSGAAINGAIGS